MKKAFVLVYMLAVLGENAPAQEGSPHLLNLGWHYHVNKMPQAAITEFKRFIFFHPDHPMLHQAYRNLAFTYRSLGEYTTAYEYFIKAIRLADSDSTAEALRLDLAATYIADEDYDLAHLSLSRVMYFTANTALKKRAYFLDAIAYIYQFRWDEAQKALREYYSLAGAYTGAATAGSEVEKLLANADEIPYRSPTLAVIMSTLVPGSGQMYTGHWWSGLNALALNAVLGWFTVDAIVEKRIVAAAISHLPYLIRYYFGNRDHAEQFAEEFNRAERQNFARRVLEKLADAVKN